LLLPLLLASERRVASGARESSERSLAAPQLKLFVVLTSDPLLLLEDCERPLALVSGEGPNLDHPCAEVMA
jgi:hypothetical protein